MTGMALSGPLQRRGLILAFLVVVADQISKFLVMSRVLSEVTQIELTSFLNLVTVWNRGVSFGLFNRDWPGTPWVLSAVALAVVAFLVIWMARSERPTPTLALGAIIGGALSNVIDRARFGAVYDFVDLHYAGWHWPAFNLADSAITLGVLALLIDALLGERKPV